MYCMARRRDVEQVRCCPDDPSLRDRAADGTCPGGAAMTRLVARRMGGKTNIGMLLHCFA